VELRGIGDGWHFARDAGQQLDKERSDDMVLET